MTINYMDKPSGVMTPGAGSTQTFFPNVLPDPSINKSAFDQILQNRGIKFNHYRALPCPNMTSLDDNSHDPVCPHCDGSGIYYYDKREIVGVMTSAGVEKQFEYNGVWEAGTATVTLPSEYSDGTQADFAMFDKLEILDFTIRLWEKKEYEPRADKKYQLRYPIQKIEYIISADQTQIYTYEVGIDFNIVDGVIEWVSGREPEYDPLSETGEVFSISYLAFPIYLVMQPIRELRATQQMMPDGTKVAIRLPQQLVVKRDFLVNAPEKLANIGSS
jgi:hypothetical protein